ncbi:MAG: methylmalonyl-CoA epimerase [Chloroflexi bacterium OHK40]
MQLKRIDHIGVIVDNLADASTLLEQGFGLTPVPGTSRPDLRTVFFRCGDVSIEVIEISDPETRQARLGEGQRARIEHIAFEVEDLNQTLEALAALGVQPTAPPRMSGSYLTFWTNPDSSDGVMYQFLQRGF